MRGTSRPMSANAVSASRPKIWGSQNEAKPASAAFRAASIVALNGPFAVSPPKIPIRIAFPDPSLQRGYDTAESVAEGQLGARPTFYADHDLDRGAGAGGALPGRARARGERW